MVGGLSGLSVFVAQYCRQYGADRWNRFYGPDGAAMAILGLSVVKPCLAPGLGNGAVELPGNCPGAVYVLHADTSPGAVGFF